MVLDWRVLHMWQWVRHIATKYSDDKMVIFSRYFAYFHYKEIETPASHLRCLQRGIHFIQVELNNIMQTILNHMFGKEQACSDRKLWHQKLQNCKCILSIQMQNYICFILSWITSLVWIDCTWSSSLLSLSISKQWSERNNQNTYTEQEKLNWRRMRKCWNKSCWLHCSALHSGWWLVFKSSKKSPFFWSVYVRVDVCD